MKILGTIQKLLSYGRNIEKYARSFQALAKAFQVLDDELKLIWNDAPVKVADVVETLKTEKDVEK
ncbi:MAG: hypothetical protein RH981_18960 [Arenibacter sp.]